MNNMAELIEKMRPRLDDLVQGQQEFEDSYLQSHLQNNLDVYGYEFPLDSKQDAQLIIVEAMIDVITAIKVWADGESYSYKNDAVQITRGLMSKHFQDTINLLKEERNEILMMDGGFA